MGSPHPPAVGSLTAPVAPRYLAAAAAAAQPRRVAAGATPAMLVR